MKYKHQRELVEGLRALADFIEQHPELPITYPSQTFTHWLYDESDGRTAKEQMATAARAMGNASKVYTGSYFDLRKKFGKHITLEFTANRENICKRVVTGHKLVPAKLVPEKMTPARIEEEVEWVCDEPLLAS